MTIDIQGLIDDVRQWGIDKGITGPNAKGTLLKQLEKTQEELIETRDAAVRKECVRMGDEAGRIQCYRHVVDGIGDQIVTLILAAELANTTFEEALLLAYTEIKNRKGTMQNGQFVKEVPSV